MTGAARRDDDRSLLRRLRLAVEAGEVRLDLDLGHLGHIHSPVAREAEDNLFLYSGVIASVAGWWVLGWRVALVVAAVALGLYFGVGRPWSRRRLARRVREQALYDTALWVSLWRFGGVALAVSGADGAVCRGPAQSWQKFAAALAPPP